MPTPTGKCAKFLALVRLYKCDVIERFGGSVAYRVHKNRYDESIFPRHNGLKVIPLENITSKVTRCLYEEDASRSESEPSTWYFLEYGRSSLG